MVSEPTWPVRLELVHGGGAEGAEAGGVEGGLGAEAAGERPRRGLRTISLRLGRVAGVAEPAPVMVRVWGVEILGAVDAEGGGGGPAAVFGEGFAEAAEEALAGGSVGKAVGVAGGDRGLDVDGAEVAGRRSR